MKKIHNIILVALFISSIMILGGCTERQDTIIDPPLENSYTELSGSISGILKKTDSPFIVREDIYVEVNTTLTLEPGVVLLFDKNKGLQVFGNIIFSGSKPDPVLLSANEYWKGILLSGSANSELKFCIIEKAQNYNDTSVIQGGALSVINSTVTISNCIFLNNRSKNGGGLYIESSSVEIKNSIFRDNYGAYFGGAIYADSSDFTAINNTFYKNRTDNFGGGIVIYRNINENIQNNIFHLNLYNTGGPGISEINGTVVSDSSFNYITFGSGDPAFISSNNLHLSPNSPCKNAGNPDISLNDVDGSRNDQGAYGGPLGDW